MPDGAAGYRTSCPTAVRLAARWSRADDLSVFPRAAAGRLSARARRDARRRLLGLRLAGRTAPGTRADAPLVVLFHGLEGSAQSHYALLLMAHARGARMARRRPAFSRLRRRAERPAARLPLRRSRGDRRDARRVARARRSATCRCTRSACRWAAARCSTGSVARATRQRRCWPRPPRCRCRSISWHPASRSTRALNRIYTRHFLSTLCPRRLAMAHRFPGLLDARAHRAGADDVGLRRRGDRAAARLRRHATTTGRARRRSRGSREIALPTLRAQRAQRSVRAGGIAARRRAEVAPAVRARAAANRRSRGFMTGPAPGRLDWVPRRLLAFFDCAASDPRGD